MKIPTFLGLFILFLLSAGLVFGTIYLQKNIQKSKTTTITPVSLEQNNISWDQVTVTWQTSLPVKTELLVSSNSNMNPLFQVLKDNRDSATAQARMTHISTVTNLLPSTSYFIKVKMDDLLYPTTDTQIKTTSSAPTPTNYNPIVGNIVSQNLQPASDALVFLLVPNADPLSTGVLQDGNFILPLTLLGNKIDSHQSIDPESLRNATLLIQKGDQKSEVKISLPGDSKPLPPIILGQNFDFRQQATSAAVLQN